MEVRYCAGCGTRITEQEIERGEVSRAGDDCYGLKGARARGDSLEPDQARPASAAKPRSPRAKTSRAPREAKAPNTTFVLLALGAAFLGAAVYGVHAVRSRPGTAGSVRKKKRSAPRRTEERAPASAPAPGPTGTTGS